MLEIHPAWKIDPLLRSDEFGVNLAQGRFLYYRSRASALRSDEFGPDLAQGRLEGL